MKINLIAIGKRMPDWVNTGYQEYAKRLTSVLPLNLIEIPLAPRSKNSNITQLLQKEGAQMLANIPNDHFVVALDVPGQLWDTGKLAQKLQQWKLESQNISLLIGGPDGLAPSCLQRANLRWSLSPLTLPHPLVRIIVAEQIYRAWSILSGHPYHRE